MMNITTIIEMNYEEVENLLDASLVLVDEIIAENLVHNFVEGFLCRKTNKQIEVDDAMERTFLMLKANGVIPEVVKDFSYEVYCSERMKSNDPEKEELPKTITISFSQNI